MIKYTGHFKSCGTKTIQLHCDDGWVSGKHRSHQECHNDRKRENTKRRKKGRGV